MTSTAASAAVPRVEGSPEAPVPEAPAGSGPPVAGSSTTGESAAEAPTGARSPLRLALDSPSGRFGLWAAGVVAAVQAAGLVLIADAIARGVVRAMEGGSLRGPLVIGVIGVLCQAMGAWAGKAAGAMSSAGAKTGLRRRFIARVFAGTGRDVRGTDGALALLATRSLDEIDDYFTAVVPALTASAVVPLVVGARILWADWVSALIIVLTLPLVPVFMILIGRYTAERVDDATRSLDRLSGHLVELARGVPVLVGLGRLPAQTRALRDVSTTYRDTTMTTLRVAFLSALALELIATLSVAVVAVFVGVRLVYGHMGLEEGLLALVLAPECYLPLRRLGAAFHSTENGLAAYDRVRRIIDEPVAPTLAAPAWGAAATEPAGAEFEPRPRPGARVDGLTVRYAGRPTPVLERVHADLGDGGLTAVTGTSGAGKSTLLAALAGLLRAEHGTEVTGTIEVPPRIAFAPQRPRTLARTVGEEIALRLPDELREAPIDAPARSAAVDACLRFACLPVDPGMHCAALSPGQQRRLSLARARASVMGGSGLVLLDEPTAHLDDAVAARIRSAIVDLSAHVPVIAATHDARLVACASHHAQVKDGHVDVAPGSLPLEDEAPAESPASEDRAEREHAPLDAPAVSAAPGTLQLFARLVRAIDPLTPKFLLSVLFGVLSTAAGAALTGLSAWLIVRASAQPPIMYLLVAIVGVRFFGLSRSVFAYAQRLWLHDAVLDALTSLRVRLWEGLARRGTADRRVSRGSGALQSLIADVDDIRDLVPRVVLPPLVAVLVSAAAIGTLFLVHPVAGWMLLAGILCALLPASAVALLADRRATAARIGARAAVLSGIVGLLSARDDLVPDRTWTAPAEQLAADDARATADERRALRATGAGEACVTAATTASALCILALLGPLVGAGGLSAELLAVAVLLPLGLTDALLDSLSAVQKWPALRRVLSGIDDLDPPDADPVLASPHEGASSAETATRPDGLAAPRDTVRSLSVEDLSLRWPGTSRPVVSGLTADFPVPGTTVVTGPTGSGKTTLVSALLRFLEPDRGRILVNGHDAHGLTPADLAGCIAWCPQEAHVFDSTLRGNLLISRPRDEAPDDDELIAALTSAGLGGLVADIGLDARVGAAGEKLSGGQRQRLAVARTLLVGADVVILDEPTAHLDQPTAQALIDDLGDVLADVGTILVTHDAALVRGAHRTEEGADRLRVSPCRDRRT
ncbi:thiol reductant ABC exporter subunit CydC [Brevibacterium yomogidense]|uniref:thiol reductant ABC exporter subunit CydC n=1 Tax=Brevibacterium yomogidense TaxID=946573 RepID=UPI0018E04E25|nr:thiol reductant ABC exporter subunit CydC [Brevibacterium yomogidense]